MLPLKQITKDLTKTKPTFTYLTERGVKSNLPWERLGTYKKVLPGSLSGWSNPDWRNKVQQKKDATSPLDVRVDDIKFVNISDVYRYRYLSLSEKSDYSGIISACPTPIYIDGDTEFGTSIDTSLDCYKQARNIALTYQRKYVAENTQPFQSQIFLGEIKETLDFIRHPFGKLRALANSANVARYNASLKHYRQAAVRHRGGVFERTNEARLLLNDVADAWFEVRFALLPLVSDITAGLGVAMGGGLQKRRSSFRGDASQTFTKGTDALYPIGELSGYRMVDRVATCKYFIHTGLVFDDVTNYSGFSEYLQDTTSDLTNFVPTVLELTPGSWLVDYFVNVGDILNTVATSSKVTKTYDCHTAVMERTHTYSWRMVPTSDPRIRISSVGPSAYTEYSRKWVQRRTGTDIFPSVTLRLPSGVFELANTSLYLSRKFANIFR